MTDHSKHFDIVVIGAGPTGLALAVAASQMGLKIQLLEKQRFRLEDRLERRGRTTLLTPSSLEYLSTFLDNDLFTSSMQIRHLDTCKGRWDSLTPGQLKLSSPLHFEIDRLQNPTREKELTQVNEGERLERHSEDEKGGLPDCAITLENHCLVNLLREQVQRQSNISFISDAQIDHVDFDNGRVMVADIGEISTSLIVACDGPTSTSRENSIADFYSWHPNQIAISTVLRHENENDGIARQIFIEKSGPIAMLPLGRNTSGLVWTDNTKSQMRRLNLPRDKFVAQLGKIWRDIFQKLDIEEPYPRKDGDHRQIQHINAISYSPVRLGHMTSMKLGKYGIAIGEAARQMHPIAGLGFNEAIEDIKAVTDEIKSAIDVGLLWLGETVSEKVADQRNLNAVIGVHSTKWLNILYKSSHPLLRSSVEFGISNVEKNAVLKNKILSNAGY